jgi:hypothetical protein
MQKRDGRPFTGVPTNFQKVPHSDTHAKERVSFLKVNDINGISFFGTLDCHHCLSIT